MGVYQRRGLNSPKTESIDRQQVGFLGAAPTMGAGLPADSGLGTWPYLEYTVSNCISAGPK